MDIEFLSSLEYKDIILRHNRGVLSSRSQADISITLGGVQLKTPVILSNMPYLQEPNPVVLDTFNRRHWGYIYHRLGGVWNVVRFVEKINEQDWYLKSISVGVKPDDWHLLKDIHSRGLKLDWLCVDVAHAYSTHVLDFVKRVRQLFPSVYLIVGNCSERDGVLELARAGADCVKLNIGVSRCCRTRQFTGFGSATVTSLIRAREALNRLGKPLDIIADGGLTILPDGEIAVGDVFKALNFGATAVMSASLFGRVSELADDEDLVHLYGNTTARARNGATKHIEGSEIVERPWHRTLNQQMDLIEDSLRSAVSYAGLTKIKDAYQSCDCYTVRGGL